MLVDRSKSIIDDVIHCNKLKLFKITAKNTSKGKQHLTLLKSDVELFSHFVIGCQTKDEKS